MQLDWVELSRLLPGLVSAIMAMVVFVGLMLRILDRQDKRDDLRNAREDRKEAAFLEALDEQRHAWQAAVDRSDTEWREALTNFQKTHSDAIGRLAEEMKTIGALVVTTNTLISQHDQLERNWMDKFSEELRRGKD